MASFATDISGAFVWALTALAGYSFLAMLYNVYFHPLRKYPGPLLHRASCLPRLLSILRGYYSRELFDLAEQYGPIVRVAPNVLIYTDADAWKDIYSNQNGAVNKGEEFEKDAKSYRFKGSPPNILSESRENHGLIRRQLSHGFSEKSLRAQEDIIKGYIDLFIRGLKERCQSSLGERTTATRSSSQTPFNMTEWFSYITFDVIGDLVFGESFGCLEHGAMDDRVAYLENGIKVAAQTYVTKEIGLDRFLTLFPTSAGSFRRQFLETMDAVLSRRMNLNTERHDLIEGLLSKQEDWDLSFERLRTNASILLIAGSETTATILSGTVFLLLRNPACLEKLTEEVRSAFKSEEEISFSSVENLSYMMACLKEGLRYYPPVAGELARRVPKGGAYVAGAFVAEGTMVAASQYAMNHCSRNFSDSFSFKPERFLQPENFPSDNFDALQPFSCGPRNCIGRNLATAEMRTVLARLVYNFDMELVDKDRDWLDQKVWFLWGKGALNVYLTPVNSAT